MTFIDVIFHNAELDSTVQYSTVQYSTVQYSTVQYNVLYVIFVFYFIQGKISFKNLKRVAKELGENLTDEELQVQYFCVLMLIRVNFWFSKQVLKY